MEYWIVVVDDEALSLTNARSLLASNNMKVSPLRSGKDLLKFMEKNNPDLILLDIMMPEMDGFETYHALRDFEEKNGRAQTPVIFLTGENDSDVERRGLKAGASDFIRKPFNKDILLRRIKNTISYSKTIESLTEEATLDKLTGFLNKASGTDKMKELCATQTGMLAILDLDSFKLVNDLYGHDMGDKVLVSFSEIVRHNVRSEDVVCRIGGDEFLAFFNNLSEESNIASLTKRLNEQLMISCEEMMGEDFGIPIGISVGAAMAPVHSTEYSELFQYADSCLYKVKMNGKHGYEIYDPEHTFEADEEDLEREIARVTQIVEERGEGKGAMLLGQDSFSWNYRFIMRFIKRHNSEASKFLFSLTPIVKKAKMMEIMPEFAKVLQQTIRKSDIILQSKPNQFFLLLPELSKEDSGGVIDRIMNNWKKSEYAEIVEVKYSTETVSYKNEPEIRG